MMAVGRAALMWLVMMLDVSPATLTARAPGGSQSAAFEVSVVRLSKPDAQGSSLNLGKGRLEAKNLTLQSLLQFAYRLSSGSDDQIAGGPKWMKSTGFDLEGKLDADTAASVSKMTGEERVETLRGMLKELLADRFQLKVHQESRTLPVLALQAIGGTRLVKFAAPVEDAEAPKSWQGLHNDGHGHVTGQGADLKMLASVLAFQPEIGGRLVVDQTGLPERERFTFELKWTPERLGQAGTEGPATSLFTAVQEQLGLKLTATKAPVDVVVVDHVQMPDEN